VRHRAARRVRAGALVAAVALLTAACGDTQPGTAAYVGDARVTVDELQGQVDDVLTYRSGDGPAAAAAPGTAAATPPSTNVRNQVPAITQQVLSQDVLHRLVGTAVARTGLQVDEGAVSSQLATLDAPTLLTQPAQSYLTPDTLSSLVRDQLVLAQLGRQAWDGLAVTVDLVQATGRADAKAKAEQMATGDETATGVVAKAVSAGQQGQRDLALTPGEAATLAATPVFGTAAGGAVAFELSSQKSQAPQWYAARIVSRSTDAAAPTTSGAVSAAQASIGQTLSLGLTLLPRLAGAPQITINPRYGVWDPTAGRVIADTDVTASVVVPPAG
jgi:hypothetical protein